MKIRRMGTKSVIVKELLKYFPAHDIYIEPFFGAGDVYFNKPKAKHNFLNDLDSDIYNLFQVICNPITKDELIEFLTIAPIHNDLFQHWKTNTETDPVKKAARFFYLSHYSYMGAGNSLRMDTSNNKKILLASLKKFNDYYLFDKFSNMDFRKFLKSISLDELNIKQAFIYNDPPYLSTDDNYSHSFTEQDFIDLLDVNINFGCKFAISEFKNDIVIKHAKERGLFVYEIQIKRTLNSRNTEILITNYECNNNLFSNHK